MNSNNYSFNEVKEIIKIFDELEAYINENGYSDEVDELFVQKIKPFIKDKEVSEKFEGEDLGENELYKIFESISSHLSTTDLCFVLKNISLIVLDEFYTKENMEKINQELPEENISKDILSRVMLAKDIDEDSRWGYYIPIVFENSTKKNKQQIAKILVYYVELFKDRVSDSNALNIVNKMISNEDIEEITSDEISSISYFIGNIDSNNFSEYVLQNLLEKIVEKTNIEIIDEYFDIFVTNIIFNSCIKNYIKNDILCKILEKEKEEGNVNKEHVDKVIDLLTIPDKEAPHITPEGIKRLWNCLDDNLRNQEFENIVEKVNLMEVEPEYVYVDINTYLWQSLSPNLQNQKLDFFINHAEKLKLGKEYRNSILQDIWLKSDDTVKKQNPQALINIICKLKGMFSVNKKFIEDIMKNKDTYSEEVFQDIALRLLDFACSLECASEYEEYLIEGLGVSETAIFDNDFLSGIAQRIDKGLLASPLNEIFKKHIILSREKIDISGVNLEKYDDKVSSFENMSEEEFSEFAENIKLLKIKNGRIPEKYCDYIISQSIRANSTLNKNIQQNISLVKRSFEDKSTYIAEEKGLDQIEFRLDGLDSSYEGVTVRSLGKTLIKYKKEDVYNPIDLINTMYHEIQHACQERDISSGKITDKYQYRIIKELILEGINPNYYKDNYLYMYSEIDARVQALLQQRQYLEHLGLTREEIEDIKIEQNNFENAIYFERVALGRADKKIYGDRREDMNEIFEREIIHNPQYLEKFPILQREFHQDGTKKTEEEMKNEKEEELANNPENRNQILFKYSVIMDKSLDESNPKASVEQSIFASIDASVKAEQRSEFVNAIKFEKNKGKLDLESEKSETNFIK